MIFRGIEKMFDVRPFKNNIDLRVQMGTLAQR
jgi:hypothetical protein